MIRPGFHWRSGLLGAFGVASLAFSLCACSASSSGGSDGEDAGDAAASTKEGGSSGAMASETGSGDEGGSSDATTSDGPAQDGSDSGPNDATSADQASGDGQSSGGSPDGGAEAASDAANCPGQLFCNGICVPNDTANCGTCGHDCNNVHVTSSVGCTAGTCTFPSMTCAAGWAHCSSNAGDGCETDITKPAHCGSCTNACPGGSSCTASSASAGSDGGSSGDGGASSTYSCVKPIALAAGTQTFFALFSDGTIKAWGANKGSIYFNGSMFGDGDTTTTQSATPVSVSNITSAIAIAAGDGHACALLADHTVSCWGDNELGQCGQTTGSITGGSDSVNTPQTVAGLSNVIAISAAWATTCALLSGGTVECWGFNVAGDLGNTTTAKCDGVSSCSSTPVAVSGISTATAISTGGNPGTYFTHTCALLTGGTIKCWGANDDAELGNGTRAPSAGPYAVYSPTQVSGISTATAVSSWSDGSCALLSGGAVKCWGANPGGALGDGNENLSASPVSVMNLSDAAYLSYGPMSDTNCAVRTGGTAECWGDGYNGQLGHGTPLTTTADVPVSVVNLTGVTQIVGAQTSECALLSTGAVYCFGYDGDDEIANSTADPSNPNPTPLVVQW